MGAKKLNVPDDLKRRIKEQGYGRIIAVYDSGDKTIDRYGVYFNVIANPRGHKEVFGMSSNPTHPQGFGQWSAGQTGRHNGKSITFDQLPEECQRAIDNQFEEEAQESK